MSPRIWLWIGVVVLLAGIFSAIQGGGFGSAYSLGYMLGSLVPGLAIIYLGWYRRRGA